MEEGRPVAVAQPPSAARPVRPPLPLRVLATLLALFARLTCGGMVYWTRGIPDGRQRIFLANHTSNLDFPLLWAYLPSSIRSRTRPVAAEDYWGRGFRRFMAHRVFNAILVMRGKLAVNPTERDTLLGKEGVQRMLDGLADGSSLIIFPEGTRGSGEQVAEFRSGLYHLCRQRPDIELVPVYMHNLNRIMPKGEVLPVPMMARIIVGAPTRYDPNELKAEFLGRIRRELEELSKL